MRQSWSVEDSADRELLVCTLLHCVDIGNPTLPREQAVTWALMLRDE